MKNRPKSKIALIIIYTDGPLLTQHLQCRRHHTLLDRPGNFDQPH